MKSNLPHRSTWKRFHTPWPFALLMLTPHIVEPVIRYFHLPQIMGPFLIVLLWMPFLIVDMRVRHQKIEREKQALQEKYDAEDVALFGSKLQPLSSDEC